MTGVMRIQKENGFLAGVLLVDFLFSISYVTGLTILSYLAFISFVGALVIYKSKYHLYIYISLMPLFSSITLGDTLVLFAGFFISIFKLLIEHKRFRASSIWVLCFAYLITIELVYDLFNWSIGQFLNLFTALIFVMLVLQLQNWERIDYKIFLNLMIFVGIECIILTIISTMKNGVSLSTYFNSSEYWVRFGEDKSSHSLGGAMGIPIYAVVSATCAYIKLTTTKKLKLWQIMIYIGIIVGCITFGLLTHSRNFFLGLIAAVTLIVFSSLVANNNRRGLLILIFLVLLGGYIYYQNQAWISQILSLFEYRGRWTEDSRIQIWTDCLNYWVNNPLSLIFGLGAKNYTFVGANSGYLFYMCAHNFILDGLMSWGIIGFGLFIGIIVRMYKRMNQLVVLRRDILFFAPLLSWFVMKMTSGSFVDIYEYFFIISLTCIAAHHAPKEQNRESAIL